MTAPTDSPRPIRTIAEVAQVQADFYAGRLGNESLHHLEEIWAPDVAIHVNSVEPVLTREQWVEGHSPSSDRDWSPVHMDVDRVVVGDDAFVLQATVHGLAREQAVPVCLVFSVRDGVVVRMDEYIDTAAFTR